MAASGHVDKEDVKVTRRAKSQGDPNSQRLKASSKKGEGFHGHPPSSSVPAAPWVCSYDTTRLCFI